MASFVLFWWCHGKNQLRLVLNCVAGRLRWSEDKVRHLAHEVAEELASTARPAEAAAVRADYLQDADNAVALLSQAAGMAGSAADSVQVISRIGPLTFYFLDDSAWNRQNHNLHLVEMDRRFGRDDLVETVVAPGSGIRCTVSPGRSARECDARGQVFGAVEGGAAQACHHGGRLRQTAALLQSQAYFALTSFHLLGRLQHRRH